MEIPYPEKDKITIYSKSGCINCSKVKSLLKDKNIDFNVIYCDEFILENKEEFLIFIKSLIGEEYRIFPMVFDNKQFIGGYNETYKYIINQHKEYLDWDYSF